MKTVRCATAVFSLAVAAAGALAQTPAASMKGARAIAMPDTMGANFAIADSARGTATPNAFDFLSGMWHFRFQQRRADGTWNPPFEGHWEAEMMVPGALIEDHWRSDNANAEWEAGTYTYRAYDPRRKLWTMQGVDSERAVWQPGLVWADSANRYVVQHYGAEIMRIRYFDISPRRFLWRADMSADGGKSWILDWWTMDASRIGK